MENFVLVRPEHLNHQGYLFGGVMLKWVDEFAWIAATRDFPGKALVTIGLDEVEFKHSVPSGSILRFEIERIKVGTTSVTYRVDVFSHHADTPGSKENRVFSTEVTFVHIDESGDKCPLDI